MRLGILSDIHGNAPALRMVMKSLSGVADRMVFLGDLVGYYGLVSQCLDLWDEERTWAVRGNHDQVFTDNLRTGRAPEAYTRKYGSAVNRALSTLSDRHKALIASWPDQLHVNIDGVTLSAFHGAPWDPLEGRVYPTFSDWKEFDSCTAEVILLGHTHYPMVKEHRNKLIINPGSVGQPRDRSGSACFALFDTLSRKAELLRVPYECDEVLLDAKTHDPSYIYLVEVLQR